MRDAVLEGATPAEIVALVRLADDQIPPPPHLADSLGDKGWIIATSDGAALVTIAGRTLLERCESAELSELGAIAPRSAGWGTGLRN